MITLFDRDGHKNVMFHEFGFGEMVQANQHIIVDNERGMLLDPGGHKVYARLFAEMSSVVLPSNLQTLFFSHQDPDIVAATNGWLMVTDADAYAPSLWMRFIPHFGVDKLVVERIKPVSDEGMVLPLGNCRLLAIAASFLHSPGNLHLYDPVSKILYTGDLGASLGQDYVFVEDFDAHVALMQPFHQRYMSGNRAMKAWARMARKLDIDMIAPQHGAIFNTRDNVQRFIDWVENLNCGVDLLPDEYPIPV